jgi:hypothetical protein
VHGNGAPAGHWPGTRSGPGVATSPPPQSETPSAADKPGKQDAQATPGHEPPARAGRREEPGLHRAVQGAGEDGPGDGHSEALA